MEVSRFRILFLSLLAVTVLPGCSMLGGDGVTTSRKPSRPPRGAAPLTGEPDQKPIIDPQVERREIKRSRIDTEDFELGAYVGILSIEDFESNVAVRRTPRLSPHRRFLPRRHVRPVARRPHQLREPLGLGGPADRRRSGLFLLRLVAGLERAAGRNLHRQEPRAITPRSTWWPASAAPRSPATIVSP